jgi:phage gp16-like protein
MNTAAAKYHTADDARRQALVKVQIARKDLGLDDDTYRAILKRLTGYHSAGLCSAAELGVVLDEFKAKGWKPAVSRKAGKPKPADHPAAKKARALWISLHQLGVVRNAGEPALEAFAARQLGVEKMQWADQGKTYKLIEALKAMAERAGWSQDLGGVEPARQVWVLKARLANSQAAKLADGGAVLSAVGPGLTLLEIDQVIASRAKAIWAGAEQ